jgi:flagellar hook-basal body complex protein FliE
MSLLIPSLSNLVGTISSTVAPHLTAPAAAGAPGEFGSMLASAVQQVNQLQTDAGQSIQKFLSGEGEELHNVALATQRAEIAFDLGVQVRNKVVSAYQEIMKMQL